MRGATTTLEVTRHVRLSSGPLAYTLRRSPRARRLRLTVDPRQGVIVTIPLRGSIRAADAFLGEREAWLRRHLRTVELQRARIAAQEALGPRGGVLYRGDLHALTVERAEAGRRRSAVLRVGGEDRDELLIVRAFADRRTNARVLEDWLRERASAAIAAEITRHGPALGVSPAAVSLRDPRTRWGSATRTGRLSFSWRLILAPPRALETVVVHELAHLRVFGHGAAFWAVVAAQIPDHRAWRRWLHDHSFELHSALDGAEDTPALGQISFADKLAI